MNKLHFVAKYEIENTIKATIEDCVEYCRTKTHLGLDIETSINEEYRKLQTKIHKGGLDPYLSNIVLVQIGDLEKQFVIDVRDYSKEELKPLIDFLHLNEEVTFIGQNLRFEVKHLLHKYGILFSKLHDTMICEIILHNGENIKLGLGDLVVKYLKKKKATDFNLFNSYEDRKVSLNEEDLENEDYISPFELVENQIIDKSTRLEFINIGDKPVTYKQIKYAADDITDPILIASLQRKGRILPNGELFKPIKSFDLENKFVTVIGEMELFGMAFQTKPWLDLAEKNSIEMKRVQRLLTEYVNKYHKKFAGQYDLFTGQVECKVQWSSSKQVISFFRHLGICPRGFSKQTKRVEYTVGAKDILKQLPLDFVGKYQKMQEVEEIVTVDDFQLMYLIYKKYEQLSTTFGEDFLKYVHPVTGRIHSSFVQLVNTGRMASRSPNCLSLDTEILTLNGWKKHNEVSVGDQVYAFDIDKQELVINNVANTYLGKAETYEIKGNTHFTAEVTGNHRNLFKDRRNGKLYVKDIHSFPKDQHILNASVYNNKVHTEEHSWFLQLLVATQADGSIIVRKNGDLNIRYKFKKERKIERLRNILNCSNIEYREFESTNNYIEFVIIVDKNFFKGYLDNKIFTYKLLNLSKKDREIVITELMYWDGLYIRKNTYCSVEKMNIDVIQSLFAITNKRARIREYSFNKKRNIKHKIAYNLDVTERNYTGTANSIIEEKGINDVWCVSVDTSYILCRRKGNTFITGNCQNLPQAITGHRDCFGITEDSDDRLLVADFSNMEIRCLADATRDTSMLAFLNAGSHPVYGSDFHSYSANLMEQAMFGDKARQIQPKELTDGSKNPEFTAEDNDKRSASKAFTFGLAFGKAIQSFAQDLRISEEQTELFLNSYYDAYPNLKPWFNSQHKFVAENGYIVIEPMTDFRWFDEGKEIRENNLKIAVESFGKAYKTMSTVQRRIRREEVFAQRKDIKELWKDYWQKISSNNRVSQNFPIQGTASRIMKCSALFMRQKMIEAGIYIKYVNFSNIVHDEFIIGYTPNDKLTSGEVAKELEMSMEKGGKVFNKYVRHIGECHDGKEWVH